MLFQRSLKPKVPRDWVRLNDSPCSHALRQCYGLEVNGDFIPSQSSMLSFYFTCFASMSDPSYWGICTLPCCHSSAVRDGTLDTRSRLFDIKSCVPHEYLGSLYSVDMWWQAKFTAENAKLIAFWLCKWSYSGSLLRYFRTCICRHLTFIKQRCELDFLLYCSNLHQNRLWLFHSVVYKIVSSQYICKQISRALTVEAWSMAIDTEYRGS